MKQIQINNSAEQHFSTIGGGQLKLLPGKIAGFFGIEYFTIPHRFSKEDGLTQIVFDFRAQDGQAYRHSYVHGYGPQAFWIPHEVIARTYGSVDATPDLSIHSMIDYRQQFSIKFEDGRVYFGKFKYTDVWFDIFIGKDTLHVKNRFHVGSGQRDFDFIVGDYGTVYYDLPYEKFLWRKAAKIVNDDYDFEGADYIDVVSIPEILQIEKSPIVIV